MLKVAYLLNRYPTNTLTAIRREIHAVERMGVEVVRYAHRPSSHPFADVSDEAEALKTEYLAVRGILPLIPDLLLIFAKKPRRFMEAIKLCFSLGGPVLLHFAYLAMACRMLRDLRRRQIHHIHTHFAQGPSIVATLLSSLGGPSWTMTVHGPEDLWIENEKYLRTTSMHAARVVAISQWAADHIRETVSHERRITIVGMGVDGAFLDPPLPIRADLPMLCIGRLDERKGHTILLDAMANMMDRDYTFRLELIGDGPLRDDISSRISALGLSRHVTFRGWMTEMAIKESLDGCKFLILPSLDEGLPVVLMEAFARGRPVIATDVAGISELVIDQINGLLVPPGNAAALSDAILAMQSMSPDLLTTMGSRGRYAVSERHNTECNSEILISLWQSITSDESS